MFTWIYKSEGIKRTICSILTPLAVVAPHIPALAPYTELILSVAALFGASGVVAAGAKKLTLK